MSTIYTTADGKAYITENGTVLIIGNPLLAGLITDRTQEDVNRWSILRDKGWERMTEDERSEWLGQMKGRYNHTDWNRVEEAVGVLSERVREWGYTHPHLTVKTDWNREDVPTREDWERYFGNVAVLRSAVRVTDKTPGAPTVHHRFNYARANDLEQILVDIDSVTEKIQESWCYAGDIYLGEV